MVAMGLSLLLLLILVSTTVLYFHLKYRHSAVYYTREGNNNITGTASDNSIGFITGDVKSDNNCPNTSKQRFATVHAPNFRFPDVVA